MSEPTSPRSNKPIWMRRDIWAVALFVAICVANATFGDMSGPTIYAVTFLATVAALCSSMGFWLGFGESWLRFAVIPVGLCLVTFLACVAFRHAEPFLLGIFCFMTAFMVGLPIAVVRMVRRGRLLGGQDNASINSREVLRFNIWQVLVFMTVVCMLLSIGRATLSSASMGNSGYLKLGVAGATLGICSVVVVWATLGRQPLLRNIVSCVVASGLGYLNAYFMYGRGSLTWIWVSIAVIVWLEMTILMWLVRSEGYRFVVASDSQ